MTPKEKAEELYKKMYIVHSNIYPSSAKQCALVAVDEILNEHMFDDSEYSDRRYDYWDKVKQEIEKI